MRQNWKRILSVVLSITMLFSMAGMNTVFATEGSTTLGLSSLCEHHRSHTADCGYTEGTQEAPCTHEHTDDCYKDETPTASDNDALELDCRHSHDEDCGYAPAVPGTPCTFQCEDCGDKDSGQQTPPADNNLTQITGFAGFDPDGFTPLRTIVVDEKTTVAAIGLPDTLAEGMTESALPYITVNIAGMKNPNTKDTSVTTADALKTALESSAGGTINVTEDITIKGSASLLMVAMGADHTLDISSGKTLTIGGGTGNNDAALINLNNHTLTVTGGNGGSKGKLLINNYGSNGIYGNPGTLNLENVQVEVTNSIQGGLGNIQTLNIKDGATVTLNGDGDSLMRIYDGQTATVETGGSVTITKSSITLYGGNLHINGGDVHVNSGSGRGIWTGNGSTLKLSSGTLDGTGTIALYKGCKVEGLGGKFTDRGAKLTASGVVTVGMPSVSPATNGLTEGDYSWDAGSNTFSKSGYTVSGAVKDSRGNGIPGATVTLEYWSAATAYVTGTTTTDADGTYTFSNISASFYSTGDVGKIYNQDYRIKASKDGYAEIAGELFSVEDKNVTGKEITLTTGSGTTTYAVTVTGGTASPTTAAQGEAVTITANAAPSGQRFKEWTISPSATFTGGTSKTDAIAKFTMPGQAVTATAVYENIPATVTGVTVSPGVANVQKGTAQQFGASVQGTNNPVQTVTWAVSGGKTGTSISTGGLLTVAADETAQTLTVTATSTVDTSKSGTATVTVTAVAVTKYQLKDTPQTGDNSSVLPWLLVMLGALTSCSVLLITKKRRDKKRHV